MQNTNEQSPDPDEFDRPGRKSTLPPLDPLPEREWTTAVIMEVEFKKVYFNGEIQYLTKGTGKDAVPITDKDGKKVERREIRVVYGLANHKLPNGEARRAWAHLSWAFGEKAKLPKYLGKLGMIIDDTMLPTPNEVIGFLKDKRVCVQFGEFMNGKQKVLPEAVKPYEVTRPYSANKVDPGREKQVITSKEVGTLGEVAWDE